MVYTLGSPRKSEDNKTLCLVAGLPYSGKTTFARYLSEKRGYPFLEGDALDAAFPDMVRGTELAMGLLMFWDSESRRRSVLAKHRAAMAVYELRNNSGVVTDSIFTLWQERVSFIEGVKYSVETENYFRDKRKNGINIVIEAYWMDTDLGMCLERYEKDRLQDGVSGASTMNPREGITGHHLIMWHHAATLPTKEEGFDKIFLVKGFSPVEFDITEQVTY